jgi:hypothetical protein
VNILPSASGLDRAVNCAASCVLPRVDTEAGAPAHRGNEVHKYLENIANGMPQLEALALVEDDYREWCAGIDVEKLMEGIS